MLQETIQGQPTSEFNEKDADISAATLAFATKLSEGLLPKIQPQTQETGATSVPNEKDEEMPTKEEKAPKMDMAGMKEEMGSMMEEMKKEMKDEMKKMMKEEMSEIKESIQEALNENE